MTSLESLETPNEEPTHTAAVDAVEISEVDLSGYNYDLVPTYKMIDDFDDQDTLFRIQFLQAFGITDDEYHPEIVSAVINDLYERYIHHTGIRHLIEAHPLYNSKIRGHSDEDDAESSTASDSIASSNNSEMIFCMMFSFQLFDLFHKCLRHAKHGEEIPKAICDEITECWRTMF